MTILIFDFPLPYELTGFYFFLTSVSSSSGFLFVQSQKSIIESR